MPDKKPPVGSGPGDSGKQRSFWNDTIESARSASAHGASTGPATSAGVSEPLLASTSAGSGSQQQRGQRAAEEAVRRLHGASKKGSKAGHSNFFQRLRQRSISGEVDNTRMRQFITRLATALHAYGSSAARTEYLIEKASARLQLDVSIAVFPSLVLLSFDDSSGNGSRRETVLLTVTQDLDVDKLGRVDEVARSVGQDKHEILVAYWQLRAIANSPATFGPLYRLAAFLMMAAAAAPLFFGGSLKDALLAGLLGLLGGLIELWAMYYSPVAASVVEFLAAVAAAFITRLIISLTSPNTICFYPSALSSLVWFLPGLSLTLGVNELVAKTFVAGSSHVVAAIFSAFQLGFGVAVGANLVFWDTTPLSSTCSDLVLPPPLWAKAAWFGIYVLASNILLNARFDQWPGMCIVSFIGYVVSELTTGLGNEASSILAALAISISGTLYSKVRNQFPLAMKTAGILVLVPGGIGVSGVAALLQKNSAGTIFVFEMLMVALAITLGLLLGKIFFPETLFGYTGRTRADKKSIAEDLRQESFMEGLGHVEEEEEDMAF